jgi:hypothetical protein
MAAKRHKNPSAGDTLKASIEARIIPAAEQVIFCAFLRQ